MSTLVRLPNDIIKIQLTIQINSSSKRSIKTPQRASLDRLLPIPQVPYHYFFL